MVLISLVLRSLQMNGKSIEELDELLFARHSCRHGFIVLWPKECQVTGIEIASLFNAEIPSYSILFNKDILFQQKVHIALRPISDS